VGGGFFVVAALAVAGTVPARRAAQFIVAGTIMEK
jgi:hypothetical protein